MFGMDNMISELMSNKLEETLAVIRQVMEQFQDPVRYFFLSLCQIMMKIHFLFFLEEFNDIYLCLHS